MVTSFTSVPELTESCDNSSLKSLVFCQLRTKVIPWNFVSGTVCPDGTVQADFDSEIKGSDQKYHLSAKVTPQGEYHAYSII